MTDKDKIRAEVLRLKDDVGIGLSAYDMGAENGAFDAYKKVLAFIDSLSEEPVSKDLDKEIDNYISEHFFGSETLGFFSNRSKEEPNYVDIDETAKHFAKWQKEQMIDKACVWLEENAPFRAISHEWLWNKIHEFRKVMEEQL